MTVGPSESVLPAPATEHSHAKTLAVAAALGVWLLALIAVRPLVRYPLNDDWVYGGEVMRLLSSGRYSPSSFAAAWGMPQVFAAAAVARVAGFSYVMLHVLSLSATAGSGVVVGWLVGRVTRSTLTVFAAVVSFFFYAPIFLAAGSFQTDSFFLLFWIGAVALLGRSLDIESESGAGKFVAWGTLAGLAAIAERQFGLSVAAGEVLYCVLRRLQGRPFRLERHFLVSAVVQVLVFLALFSLRGGLPQSLSHGAVPPPASFLAFWTFSTLVYMAWAGFPLLARWLSTSAWLRLGRPTTVFHASATVLVVVGAVALASLGKPMPYFGNLLSEFGVFPENTVLLGVRDVALGGPWRAALTLVGVLGSCVLLARVLDRGIWRSDLVVLCALVSVAYLVLSLVVTGQFFDRYANPVVPCVLVIAASGTVGAGPGGVGKALTVASLLCVVAFTTSTVADYLRWNDARWEAGEWVLSQGVAADRFIGGYEWEGSHREVRNAFDPSKVQPLGAWWLGLFAPSSSDAVLAFSVLPRHEVWTSFEYHRFWPKPGVGRIYVLRARRAVSTGAPHAAVR